MVIKIPSYNTLWKIQSSVYPQKYEHESYLCLSAVGSLKLENAITVLEVEPNIIRADFFFFLFMLPSEGSLKSSCLSIPWKALQREKPGSRVSAKYCSDFRVNSSPIIVLSLCMCVCIRGNLLRLQSGSQSPTHSQPAHSHHPLCSLNRDLGPLRLT